jgi:hypothetical protein
MIRALYGLDWGLDNPGYLLCQNPRIVDAQVAARILISGGLIGSNPVKFESSQ